MIQTMYAAPGIGLAATAGRRGAADLRRRHLGRAATPADLLTFINPEFVERDGMQLEEEGCLSVPGFNATVARPSRAVVKGLDRDGSEQIVEGTGLLARCFQHEMDHLDGTLFVDRLRGLQKDLIVRKIKKLARRQMVSAAARRLLRHAAVRGADAAAAARVAAHRSSASSPSPTGRAAAARRSPTRRSRRWRSSTALPVFQPERLRDPESPTTLRAWQPDLGVVAAYGKIIPDDLLALPRLGMINVHASLLPKYRGAAPVHRAVIDGEAETGVTIMRVVRRARCRRDARQGRRGRSAPTRPATTSSATSPSSARALLVDVVDRLAAGRRRRRAAGRHARHLCAEADEGRRADRLDAARRVHPQPRARPVSVAARLHVSRRRTADPAEDARRGRAAARRAARDRSSP